MDYQIATEAYAKSIGGKNVSYTSNLGCTKSRAIALGCDVTGTYLNNQLVCQKDLSKAVKIYAYHCSITYSSSYDAIFYIISDSTLIDTKNNIDASTTADCALFSTYVTEVHFYGDKYVNADGTFNMTSGQTYHILYVPIAGDAHPSGKLPPGDMQNNWKSAGSFVFNSSKYNYDINLSVQL